MARTSARRRLRSHQERVGEDSDLNDGEWTTANSAMGQQGPHRSVRARTENPSSSTLASANRTYRSATPTEQQSTSSDDTFSAIGSPPRDRGSRRESNLRSRRRGGSDYDMFSPSSPVYAEPPRPSAANGDHNSRARLRGLTNRTDSGLEWDEESMDEGTSLFGPIRNPNPGSPNQSWGMADSAVPPGSSSNLLDDVSATRLGCDEVDVRPDDDAFTISYASQLCSRISTSSDDFDFNFNLARLRARNMKRSRDKFENAETRDALSTLDCLEAVAVMLYHIGSPDPGANDVWPNLRSMPKLPARYYRLSKDPCLTSESRTARNNLKHLQELLRPTKLLKRLNHPNESSGLETDSVPPSDIQWPPKMLPTELFEEIASYLNRDDIKAMRLVCREFNKHVSQVLFKTVVVPFNTEIYGMLGQEKPDLKGKKKVRVETQSLQWKNANGDDVYNGHGLDVFQRFGHHTLSFGMSFEVNEDLLANPPEKSVTERHTSFWGTYDWPFEEYCRFDDVAGLESAADETPRMTTAFSELSKVRKLALSIDSGLGWLNGPDRSIRGRILQRPPEVFGPSNDIPDRRAQARQELWDYVKSSHRQLGSDVKLAALYKIETSDTLTDFQGAPSLAHEQPDMPFIDSHLIHETAPYDAADVPIPTSFDDPDVLDRFVRAPTAQGTGILFSSPILQTDAGQLKNPIIPTSLTKAQKEWLLETEWAQRAFLSSYMLSVMDNPATFDLVRTLKLSRLSDRYLSMFNRRDFWDALPTLNHVTIQVIPGWRTVSKDEAGFVETPKINPSGGINPFYDLLHNMISPRKNIKTLVIGWATGGEHAEGIHARNKLLLPPPILPADKATEQNAAALIGWILQFPYVEELTLKNCWISPAVLLQFVAQHDALNLKNLILDSVSLTAVLRGQGNIQNQNHVHQAGGLPVANQAPAAQWQFPQAVVAGQQGQQNAINPQQFLAFHIQALQMQIQHMQTQGGPQGQQQLAQLQAQLQNLPNQIQPQNPVHQQQQQQQQQNLNPNQVQNNTQIQHNQNQQFQQLHLILSQAQQNFVVAPQQPPLTTHLSADSPQAVLKARPRDGSWLNILDIISPGLNLFSFQSEHSQANPERKTSLESISFISCGYAKLPCSSFDQSAIEPLRPMPRNSLFTKKANALAHAMLSAKWPLLGEIVQEMDRNELVALNAGWDLEEGWGDAEEAVGPEFDGLLPGGTGRFTGVVRKRSFANAGSTA